MNAERLETLLDQRYSIRQVAELSGKSYTTVRYWMKKYGLKSTYASYHMCRKWTDGQCVAAAKANTTIRGALQDMGLDPRGSNYRTFYRAVERLKVDISHMTGISPRKGESSGRGRPLSEYLVLDGPPINGKFKQRMIRDGLLDERCEICGMPPEWKGSRLVLRLDHISGNNRDNRRENLRLVCPNCDSQLPTFCSRNRNRNKMAKQVVLNH